MNNPRFTQFCCLPHGLFWRVFFTIGVAVLISAVMSFGLFYMSAARNIERVFAQDYTGLVAQVREALDNDTLIELQSRFQSEKHAMLVVLEGREALGTRPPPWVMKKIRRNHERRPRSDSNKKPPRKDRDDDQEEERERRDFELMQTRLHHDGRNYRVIILPTVNAIRESAKPLAILLFLAMLVGASSIIAWMFSRPLRSVQSTARQLSTGDMSARVPDKITQRRDSIGELGSDFNHMAGRIQHLLEAQQQLLRDVSHELRTPLARMQVALVLSQDNPEKAGTHLNRIESEIDRLNDLIGSILSLSKVESGATTLDETSFDFAQLLQQITQDAEFEFSDRRITADIECPNIDFFGDREQLRSGLENIVRNAMRYSPDKGTIEIQLQHGAEEIHLRIRDHGPGVEDEQLPRLFEAFYRAERARSAEQTGGHGVGLAIARSIVALHGGKIAAENATGGGLEVSIHLPKSRLR
ncbi:MAG: sensor histidine kinase [Granulosicoccaceae bacterium]